MMMIEIFDVQKEKESMRGSRDSSVFRGSEEEERKKERKESLIVFLLCGDVFCGQTL